jgi:hypothetical protein
MCTMRCIGGLPLYYMARVMDLCYGNGERTLGASSEADAESCILSSDTWVVTFSDKCKL